MMELNAGFFLGAVSELRQLIVITNVMDKSNDLLNPIRQDISNHLARLIDAMDLIGAKLAIMSAQRLLQIVSATDAIKFETVGRALHEIESRFGDHLQSIGLFVLSDQETVFMKPADSLIELDGFSISFPNAAFEVEEASKCLALGRYNASVFHSMRMLEIGIRAIAKRLGTPDPTSAAERNWAFILKAIRSEIDAQWPSGKRLPDTVGAKLDKLYASLDAVKNPWRNATMHVENNYAPHEAIHILRCSAFFMRDLMLLSDEQGNPPP